MNTTLAARLGSILQAASQAAGSFEILDVAPGARALLRVRSGADIIELELSPPAPGIRSFRQTERFSISYRGSPPLAVVESFVTLLRRAEGSIPTPLLDELWPDDGERLPVTAAHAGRRAPIALEHVDRARGSAERPLRVVLANLCEDPWDYGPGASEYLRAKLLSTPDLADRIELALLFLGGTDTESFAERIASHDPDFVGFTCYSWNLASTARTSRRPRELTATRAGATVIVWGGVSFALLRERSDWFSWWGDVDAVAIGSGEQTIVDLLRRVVERGPGRGLGDAPIRGALLHAEGHIHDGGSALAPRVLGDVPSPYQRGTAFQVARPFVEMARGCLFQCAFCSDARASRQGLWMTQTVDRIAADVAAIAAWPCAREVDAGASTANVSDRHFAEVCEGIRRGDPTSRLAYSFQMYPAVVRPAQRAALDGVRVKRIGIGVQSSTAETWGPMRRKSTVEHIRRSADILRGVGLLFITVILGLPGETYETFVRMVDQLLEIDDISLAVHRLLVLPGTQFHVQHEALGLSFASDQFYRVLGTTTMPPGDLARAQDYVRTRAVTAGVTSLGERRIDWTNFDDQRLAFDGAPRPIGA